MPDEGDTTIPEYDAEALYANLGRFIVIFQSLEEMLTEVLAPHRCP